MTFKIFNWINNQFIRKEDVEIELVAKSVEEQNTPETVLSQFTSNISIMEIFAIIEYNIQRFVPGYYEFCLRVKGEENLCLTIKQESLGRWSAS